MTKVIVLGGLGQIGGVVVHTLAYSPEIKEVVIADLYLEKAQELADQLGEGVSAVYINAEDPDSIKAAVKGCDIAVNCVGPFYKTVRTILRAVIEAGVNYVDVWDDVSVVDDLFALDQDAKDAGVTAVIGLGFSPGVTNLMARLAVENLLDETDALDIYHAHGGEPKEGAGVIGHRFHCMSVDVPMFLDGELKTVKFFEPDGIALREKVNFLGLGENVQVYPYPHPEQVTFPRYFQLNQVTNKGTVLPDEYYELTMNMCALGLASTEPVVVNGQEVNPQDFSIAYIIQEREKILKATNFGVQRGSSTVSVKGTKNGKPLRIDFKAYSEGGKHSGLGVATGVPAAIGAVLLHQGKLTQTGVLSPEGCVDPVDFFSLWEEMTALVTGKKKPIDSIVEFIDENGQVTQKELIDLL